MPKVDRNNPKRSSASESRYTLFDFERDFPAAAACLDCLVGQLYPDGVFCPKCNRVTKHHREKARPSYSCQFCGHREHPMVGTIFENSATSLRLWFYAIYLMASTRCGISAKQLERELGVTYKTAYRMFKQIRSLLSHDEMTLGGTVEMDEAFIGGQTKWRKHHTSKPGRGTSKAPVFGMVERGTDGKHGRIIARTVENTGSAALMPHVQEKVLPAFTVYTDEWKAYNRLGWMGYEHSRVRHAEQVYLSGDVHTNTVEGFWSLLKRGISGVYHRVSSKHLQSYVDEYTFRYNNRDATGRGIFDAFLGQIEKAQPDTATS